MTARQRLSKANGLKAIILATDGSPDARAAALVAAGLSSLSGAALHLVHAWHAPAFTWQWPGSDTWFGELRDQALAVLDAEAVAVADAGAAVAGTHLELGFPPLVVARVAELVNADLIVAGRRGLGGAKRFLLGSVSERLVRSVGRPVLVVRGGAGAWPPSRIVMGYDGTALASKGASLSASIAQVLDVPLALKYASWLGDSRSRLSDMERTLGQEVRRLRAEFGIQVDHGVAVDEPFSALFEEQNEPFGRRDTLIVVGQRNLGFLGRLSQPSVSGSLLHDAEGPLLIYPCAAAESGSARVA